MTHISHFQLIVQRWETALPKQRAARTCWDRASSRAWISAACQAPGSQLPPPSPRMWRQQHPHATPPCLVNCSPMCFLCLKLYFHPEFLKFLPSPCPSTAQKVLPKRLCHHLHTPHSFSSGAAGRIACGKSIDPDTKKYLKHSWALGGYQYQIFVQNSFYHC